MEIIYICEVMCFVCCFCVYEFTLNCLSFYSTQCKCETTKTNNKCISLIHPIYKSLYCRNIDSERSVRLEKYAHSLCVNRWRPNVRNYILLLIVLGGLALSNCIKYMNVHKIVPFWCNWFSMGSYSVVYS